MEQSFETLGLEISYMKIIYEVKPVTGHLKFVKNMDYSIMSLQKMNWYPMILRMKDF